MTATLTESSPAPPALPTPANRPEADIVVFDGHCGFCRAQVNRLLRWDAEGGLAYLSLHDAEVARRWPDIDRERLLREMLVVDRYGERHWGPEAIGHLARRLPRLWWAAAVFRIPGAMFVWRRIYRWVARNRYRISAKLGHETCADGACAVHFK
ncbi:MAG TPA: DUF393 domain-containing protein [Lacipirellulaceae bacterium]|nr:DUF393 domain-containing protein [Lacipirellulaceae bacterium]